jgi:ferric-chelate reductase
MFLAAVLHGALWIRNHLQYDLPILGQQKEGSGVATLGLLGVIVVSSLPVARRWCYQVFYIMQCVHFFLGLTGRMMMKLMRGWDAVWWAWWGSS